MDNKNAVFVGLKVQIIIQFSILDFPFSVCPRYFDCFLCPWYKHVWSMLTLWTSSFCTILCWNTSAKEISTLYKFQNSYVIGSNICRKSKFTSQWLSSRLSYKSAIVQKLNLHITPVHCRKVLVSSRWYSTLFCLQTPKLGSRGCKRQLTTRGEWNMSNSRNPTKTCLVTCLKPNDEIFGKTKHCCTKIHT